MSASSTARARHCQCSAPRVVAWPEPSRRTRLPRQQELVAAISSLRDSIEATQFRCDAVIRAAGNREAVAREALTEEALHAAREEAAATRSQNARQEAELVAAHRTEQALRDELARSRAHLSEAEDELMAQDTYHALLVNELQLAHAAAG